MIDMASLIYRFNFVHPLALDRARCHDVDSQVLSANAIHSREHDQRGFSLIFLYGS
jgi:hypothetical protein